MTLSVLQGLAVPQYSLWLMPPPPTRARFAALIRRLSTRLGTPVFEPHLTLAGADAEDEAEIAGRAELLANTLAPVPVTLTELDYTDEYFRCLYLRTAQTPALLGAYRRACDALGTAPENFMPHVSLVYGNLNAADKERLIAELGRNWDLAFTIERVALYLPQGPPQDWRRVADFTLRGN